MKFACHLSLNPRGAFDVVSTKAVQHECHTLFSPSLLSKSLYGFRVRFAERDSFRRSPAFLLEYFPITNFCFRPRVLLQHIPGLLRVGAALSQGPQRRLRVPDRPLEPGLHVRHAAHQPDGGPDGARGPRLHLRRLPQPEKYVHCLHFIQKKNDPRLDCCIQLCCYVRNFFCETNKEK